jgi:ubiquinone/menaquinone biosynthesis C-methylase UbiE
MTTKEKLWTGYYSYYLAEAERQGVNALRVLDEQWHDGHDSAQVVLPHLSSQSVVLEIACGLGRVSRFVAPHCHSLHCADLLPEALAECSRNLTEFSNVNFHLLNGYDLEGFPGDYFDCVYSFTTFFHFDFELVVYYFREVKRVLKTGGTAIIEFKRWNGKADIEQLLEKIEHQGGIRIYESELDKWRYVSKDMLKIVCDYHDLQVINDDTTQFTFQK